MLLRTIQVACPVHAPAKTLGSRLISSNRASSPCLRMRCCHTLLIDVKLPRALCLLEIVLTPKCKLPNLIAQIVIMLAITICRKLRALTVFDKVARTRVMVLT